MVKLLLLKGPIVSWHVLLIAGSLPPSHPPMASNKTSLVATATASFHRVMSVSTGIDVPCCRF